MSSYPYTSYQSPTPPPQPPGTKRRIPWWGWMLIAGVGFIFLSCAGIIALVTYVGHKGPDTKAYAGNELPAKFVTVVQSLNLLEAGEQIRFFYSDAMTDIKEGFYFVSDRKVVVYIADAATPATVVPFAKIAKAEIERTDAFLEDSTITLTLTDDSIVTFPVSHEGDRDKLFHETIEKSIKRATGGTTKTSSSK